MKNWFKKKDKVPPESKDLMLPTHPITNSGYLNPFRVDDLHFKGLMKDTLSREDIMYIMKVISDYQLLVESFEKKQQDLSIILNTLLEKAYGKDWRLKYHKTQGYSLRSVEGKFRKKHRDFIDRCWEQTNLEEREIFKDKTAQKFKSFIPELFILLRPDLYKNENQLKYTIVQQDINEEKS